MSENLEHQINSSAFNPTNQKTMLTTYRARLIFYIILLTTFLTATLAYTYFYSRNAILEQARTSMANTAHLLTSNIKMEENTLFHYAKMLRDDPRIKEYMFMITKVGAEADALTTMYERNFGWLPVDRYIFIDLDGQIQLGKNNPDLAEAVLNRSKHSPNKVFYFQSNNGFKRNNVEGNGLELVAWATVSYQDTPIGIVAVTHNLNSRWLTQHKNYSGGHLFIEQNNTVQSSTLPDIEGITFLPHGDTIIMKDEIYRVRAIPLSGEGMNTLHLWHGVSEQELVNQLERHSQLVLLFTILGSIAILVTGLMMARNFNRPLAHLMHITQAVTQGAIPMMDKSVETNEIDTLANRFSEMLQSLREKQEEIDVAHKQLEESAITDTLTGLFNRRHLKQIFPKLLAQAGRDNHCLSGLMLDLDYFKEINDRYGHLAGDQCLSHLAKLLNNSSRASDYIFRVGGEEFLILSLNDTPTGGELLAEKICSTLAEQPCTFRKTLINMTTSIGVGRADNQLPPEAALTNLFFHADKALYTAKNNGRNQVAIYNDKGPPPQLRDAAS
jgi:diguanylate cyclase (GGDEF)-like protein